MFKIPEESVQSCITIPSQFTRGAERDMAVFVTVGKFVAAARKYEV